MHLLDATMPRKDTTMPRKDIAKKGPAVLYPSVNSSYEQSHQQSNHDSELKNQEVESLKRRVMQLQNNELELYDQISGTY
jgi:hypothetical protein